MSETLTMSKPALKPALRWLLALLAGALAPLAFAPVNMWLLGPVSIALFYFAIADCTPRQGLLTGWLYGLGSFGVGTSWIYVSISEYGNAPDLLAGFITLVFCSFMAMYCAFQAWYFRRFAIRFLPILGFTASWVLSEWLRSWLFSGFPWLLLGSAHNQSMFAGIAPIAGVYGVSFAIALSGAIIGELLIACRSGASLYTLAKTQLPTALLILWGVASLTSKLTWVETLPNTPLRIGIVQGNVSQNLKFNENYLQQSLDRYEALSATLGATDLVLWPETAIPQILEQAGPIVDYFGQQARNTHSTLITGIFSQQDEKIHNSIVALGNGSGLWHKQKLVPFGEYVPLRSVLSTLLQIFDLPMSSLSPGPARQEPLQAGNYLASPFICYEVVYPDFVRAAAVNSDFLITISNDTWFGGSWGPHQHLQIAAIRALENGRYMLRATNNGISAIISEKGKVLAQTPQFEEATLVGQVPLFSGSTPFSYFGSFPVLLISGLILLINFYPIGTRGSQQERSFKT